MSYVTSTFPSTIAPASCSSYNSCGSNTSSCTPQYSSPYGYGSTCSPYGGSYGYGSSCSPYGGSYGSSCSPYGGSYGSQCSPYGSPYGGLSPYQQPGMFGGMMPGVPGMTTTPGVPGMPFVNPGASSANDTRYIDGKKCRRLIKLRPLF